MHKAGFVNIVGNPNVGKSTLMNALVGERKASGFRLLLSTGEVCYSFLLPEDIERIR